MRGNTLLLLLLLLPPNGCSKVGCFCNGTQQACVTRTMQGSNNRKKQT
jgi:hypothetical protein